MSDMVVVLMEPNNKYNTQCDGKITVFLTEVLLYVSWVPKQFSLVLNFLIYKDMSGVGFPVQIF
jgi:hypothetical protein